MINHRMITHLGPQATYQLAKDTSNRSGASLRRSAAVMISWHQKKYTGTSWRIHIALGMAFKV